MDLRLISTRNRDASSQFVMYDGLDLGYVVFSTARGQWPYSSKFVHGDEDLPGQRLNQRYWPVVVEKGTGYRLPPEKDKWQAYRRLKLYHDAPEAKKDALREMASIMRSMDDLRAQDPNHADLAALSERMKHLVKDVEEKHGGY